MSPCPTQGSADLLAFESPLLPPSLAFIAHHPLVAIVSCVQGNVRLSHPYSPPHWLRCCDTVPAGTFSPLSEQMTASFKSLDDREAPVSDESALFLHTVTAHSSVLTPFLSSSEETGGWPAVILDGGYGSELERLHGGTLDPVLWSAHCVSTDAGQRLVKTLHTHYLNAGADLLTATSYQASVPGFQRSLLVDHTEADRLLRLTVELAVQARDEWWQVHSHHQLRERPLVAASIGSFGALMAGGQEYTGDYRHVEAKEVEATQRERLRVVCEVKGVDVLLLETLPNFEELQTLLTLLPDIGADLPVLISLSSGDGRTMRDGTPLDVAFNFVLDNAAVIPASSSMFPAVIGLGVNCCSPRHGEEAMRVARTCVVTRWKELTESQSPSGSTPSLPLLLLYPNSGEEWDAQSREWTGKSWLEDEAVSQTVVGWYESGARIIGGCCRTGPAFIHRIRRILLSREENEEEAEEAAHHARAVQPHPSL